MEIRIDDLAGTEIFELLEEHRQSMFAHSPPESVHALDIEGMLKPQMTFWSAWEDGAIVGCGALKELDPQHGEIKSMRTVAAHLRKGVGKKILEQIISEAEKRGYKRLSLETGSDQDFNPARRLYANFGFEYCGPFGDYVEDPYSVFMTKEISG